MHNLSELHVEKAAVSLPSSSFFFSKVDLSNRDMSRPVNNVEDVLEPVTC